MDFIPLMIPNIHQEDISSVVEVLESGMLVQGRKVEELESIITKYIGVKHAIVVSSGTAALHLSLLALNIGKGDEVIVPAFSFVATANAVEMVGAKPVFVDISLEDFNIDACKVKDAITDKTKAIMPVHEFGLACDISTISSLAKDYNLPIIEDAACALGAKEDQRHVGSLGNLAAFSFHPRKAITSGEGGVIVTNDDKLANTLRSKRNHGITSNEGNLTFSDVGLNYRLTDIQAALLIGQLRRFDAEQEKKKKLVDTYLKHLNKDFLVLPKSGSTKDHAWQTFHVIVSDRLNRDEVIGALKSQGIGSNYGAQCIPEVDYYQKKYNYDVIESFPNAHIAYQRGLALPLYNKLKEDQIIYISEVLNRIVKSE